MSQFSYQDYTNSSNSNKQSAGDRVRVDFFKLGENEEAIVRFNISSVEDLHFATIHKPIFKKKFDGLFNPFAGVSCVDEFGSTSVNCPFCQEAAKGHEVINKAEKKVFVEMLVSYKDKTTGTWQKPIPAVWERPAGFSREIATKLESFGGNLKEILFKMTRTGSGKETRYSLDYAIPTIYSPDIVPADFTVFENYKINTHAYLTESLEDMMTFVKTGSFPQKQRVEAAKVANTNRPYEAPADAKPVEPQPQPTTYNQYQPTEYSPRVTPQVEQPVQSTNNQPSQDRPVRAFTGYSF